MTRLFARQGLGLGLVLGLVFAAGCGGSGNPPTGKACVMNTDCNNPLACTFGKCHVQCIETRDCQVGQRCVKAVGGNVCQLDEEKRCPPSGACMQPLICAIDLQCRNNCTSATDCPVNQLCASGSCAEASEVGPDGKLKVGDAGAGGSGGGTGGSGGAPGTGGSPGDGGVDAGPPVGNGPCGIPDMEPNDMRDQSVKIAPSTITSCFGTDEDVDYYELTAPSDPGGYYVISLTEVGDVEVEMYAYTVTNNGMIGHIYAANGGQDLHAYLGTSAGQKYRLQVGSFAGWKGPSKYTLKVSYMKVDDAYEPNNTRDTAKPITLGTPINAFIHDGFITAQVDDEDVRDWYTVTAGPGNLTAKVENVPMNMSAWVEIVDAAGKLDYAYSSNNGSDATLTVMGVAAGTFRISVKPFVVPGDLFFGESKLMGQLPDSYTRAYKLTVSQ
jgi:hypothetical protein